MKREKFGSRLGFILISAGCAIGLGNVWRFPYITGKYGGAAFVLIYLFFLVILGLPIMVNEFAVGRASQKSAALSFHILEPKGTKWHIYSYFAMLGNYLLMAFYTTVGGWMIAYFFKMLNGEFQGLTTEAVSLKFSELLSSPTQLFFWMVVTVTVSFLVCSRGLRNGVEKINKIMMTCLIILMFVLAINSILLPNSIEGLKFYLLPDFSKIAEYGFGEVVYAAMGQAFFTLSLGIGALAIFGSYIDKSHRLTSEAINVTLLDTFVALMAGLIIFPACAAYGVSVSSGPGLIFETLPNVFNNMNGGFIWGALFFLFMAFASLTTIIAVFENIISYAMDLFNMSRKKAIFINFFIIIAISIPCVLGFNVLSNIQIPNIGNIQSIEDFIVSNNLLPIGSMVYLLFCTSRYGWGFDNFVEEADTGEGVKFPKWTRFYITYILPFIVFIIFILGYMEKFF